jgi:hypothetical protein
MLELKKKKKKKNTLKIQIHRDKKRTCNHRGGNQKPHALRRPQSANPTHTNQHCMPVKEGPKISDTNPEKTKHKPQHPVHTID